MSDTIQLDAPSSSGPPSATLTEPGASIVVGVANVGEYQQRDFDTGDLLTWDDGGPKMGKVVTGIVVSATDTTVPDGENASRDVVPGDVVSFWCEGGKWFPYRDAVAAAGGVNVGDVMRWVRTEDDPPKKRGHNPKKNYEVQIRRPEAKDGDLADRCVDKYHELKARPALEQAPSAPGPFDGGTTDPGF